MYPQILDLSLDITKVSYLAYRVSYATIASMKTQCYAYDSAEEKWSKMSFSTDMGRYVYYTKVVTTFTGKGSDTLELVTYAIQSLSGSPKCILLLYDSTPYPNLCTGF